MAWTDEQKAKAVELYLEGEPTPENSIELIKEIAEELGQSANGVRQVLVQEKVYVKKDVAAAPGKTTTATKDGEGTKRVSKESQIDALRAAIVATGATVDEDVIGKLTGKAAAYFASVIKSK